MKKTFSRIICALVGISLLFSLVSCREIKEQVGDSAMDISKEEFEESYHIKSETTVIDYTTPKKQAVAKLEWLASFPYLEEDAKEKFLLAEEVVNEFPLSFSVKFKLVGNSFENKEVKLDYMDFNYDRPQKKDSNYEIDIVNRIGVLWLNDKLDDMYDIGDYYKAIYRYQDYLYTFPTAEELKDYETEDDWVKLVEQLDYNDSSPKDEKSKDNYYIIDLLIENYYSYNNLLKSSVDSEKLFGFNSLENRYEMIRIFKEYGNDVFGKENDDNYVINNYEEMFAEFDKKIMEEYNLAQKDFR